MTATTAIDTTIWTTILAGDELMLEYFARRSTLREAALYDCPEAEEFNLALVDRVPPGSAGQTLSEIADHFRHAGVATRIRVSPLAQAHDWPERLEIAGFAETGERRTFWTIPATVDFSGNPSVRVSLVRSPEDADLYSEIQTAGFSVRPEHRAWDRALVRSHLATGRYRFYIGRLDGAAVGVASSIPIEPGVTGMWGIATLPEARNKGVGTAILRRMLLDAWSEGSHLNFFTTTWDNRVELTYRHLGCVPRFQTRTFELHNNTG